MQKSGTCKPQRQKKLFSYQEPLGMTLRACGQQSSNCRMLAEHWELPLGETRWRSFTPCTRRRSNKPEKGESESRGEQRGQTLAAPVTEVPSPAAPTELESERREHSHLPRATWCEEGVRAPGRERAHACPPTKKDTENPAAAMFLASWRLAEPQRSKPRVTWKRLLNGSWSLKTRTPGRRSVYLLKAKLCRNS